jgi:hypothetical protein
MTTARAAKTAPKNAKATKQDKNPTPDEAIKPVRAGKASSRTPTRAKRSASDVTAKKALSVKQQRKTSTENGNQDGSTADGPPSKDSTIPADKHADKQAAKRDGKRHAKQSDKQSDKSAKKQKVIRDSFTMPKADYDRIAQLKEICLNEGVQVKKSELLRAGLNALHALPVSKLLTVVASVETVKTGRPAKG